MKKLCPEAVWLSTDKYAGATRDSAMREAGPLVLQFGPGGRHLRPERVVRVGDDRRAAVAGAERKVLVMGFDASKPLLQAIQEGDIVGSILQDPYRMGYLSTWCCVRHIPART